MLSSVSWQVYIVTIAIATVLYYAVIGKLFYSREIVRLLSRNKEESLIVESDPSEQVGLVIKRIVEVIKNAADQNIPKPELFFSLQQLIRSCPAVQQPEYTGRIRQYIKDELEVHGTHELSEEELTQLWKP